MAQESRQGGRITVAAAGAETWHPHSPSRARPSPSVPPPSHPPPLPLDQPLHRLAHLPRCLEVGREAPRNGWSRIQRLELVEQRLQHRELPFQCLLGLQLVRRGRPACSSSAHRGSREARANPSRARFGQVHHVGEVVGVTRRGIPALTDPVLWEHASGRSRLHSRSTRPAGSARTGASDGPTAHCAAAPATREHRRQGAR